MPPAAPPKTFSLKATSESIQADLVNARCVACHREPTHGNRHVGLGDVAAGGPWLRPGCPEKSLFFSVVKAGKMPPAPAERLAQRELDVIAEWILGMVSDQERDCRDSDEPGTGDGGDPDEPGTGDDGSDGDGGDDGEPGD